MPSQEIQNEYVQLVHNQLETLRRYYLKKLRWHRLARGTVIVSAALVPVLAAIDWVPRLILGVFGALAVVSESFGRLLQFHSAALTAMNTANNLERELNLFITGAGVYERPSNEHGQAFRLFVTNVEAIRRTGDQDFLSVWQQSLVPEVGQAGDSRELP